jgi:multidrug resistance efflux pump
LLIALFGHVEITSRGRGVLRAETGVQPLFFQASGLVREVNVRVGEIVQAGQPIARLDTTELIADLAETEAELQTEQRHAERERAEQQTNYAQDVELLKQREVLTRRRIDSQQSSVALLTRDQQRFLALSKEGLTTALTLTQSSQALAEQEQNWLSSRAELARIEQELVAIDRSRRAGETERSQRISQAEARRDAARMRLAQTTLSASRSGRIESLMVTAGEVTTVNTLVARLVPIGKSDFVTAFVPEQDRAFVSEGSSVRLEWDQLPVGEFGSAAAKVVRVSTETASAVEISQALAAAAPPGVYFRIELRLAEDARTRHLVASLSSGSLLTVRVALRRRRIIGLMFDPLRKWLD